MLIHALALRLGKTCSEIGGMDYAEFIAWFAFFELQKDRGE